jgi:hypothetical protein
VISTAFPFAEILWLMNFGQPRFGIERGGVAAVQFLAGYPGFPGQSRLFNARERHEAWRCKE